MREMRDVPEAFVALQERLAKSAEGAPKADELFEIFAILFTEDEAWVGSKMPMRPCSFKAIVKATGMAPERLGPILSSMTSKGLVVDLERGSVTRYVLAPPVIGFLEYTFMKRNEHLPMKRLAELADTYLTEYLLPQELEAVKTPRTRVVP